jgi:hypothetical protein
VRLHCLCGAIEVEPRRFEAALHALVTKVTCLGCADVHYKSARVNRNGSHDDCPKCGYQVHGFGPDDN